MLCPGFKQNTRWVTWKRITRTFNLDKLHGSQIKKTKLSWKFPFTYVHECLLSCEIINSGSWPPCITFQLGCHSNCHEWPCIERSQTTTKHHALRCSKYSATHPLRYLWIKQPEDGPEEPIWSTFSFWLLTESWRINPATFFRKEGIIYNKVNYQ